MCRGFKLPRVHLKGAAPGSSGSKSERRTFVIVAMAYPEESRPVDARLVPTPESRATFHAYLLRRSRRENLQRERRAGSISTQLPYSTSIRVHPTNAPNRNCGTAFPFATVVVRRLRHDTHTTSFLVSPSPGESIYIRGLVGHDSIADGRWHSGSPRSIGVNRPSTP
ncbi:hypothetical protein EDD15DRAFT_2308313 [Pisolithus albus]|nr:hypothetical protein EDD15DRAFT_2308313 [Pisolithus albus]